MLFPSFPPLGAEKVGTLWEPWRLKAAPFLSIPWGSHVSVQPKETGERCRNKIFHCPQFSSPVFCLFPHPDAPVRHFSLLLWLMGSAQWYLTHQKAAAVPGPHYFAERKAQGGMSSSRTINALYTWVRGMSLSRLHDATVEHFTEHEHVCVPQTLEINGLSAVCSHPEHCGLLSLSQRLLHHMKYHCNIFLRYGSKLLHSIAYSLDVGFKKTEWHNAKLIQCNSFDGNKWWKWYKHSPL